MLSINYRRLWRPTANLAHRDGAKLGLAAVTRWKQENEKLIPRGPENNQHVKEWRKRIPGIGVKGRSARRNEHKKSAEAKWLIVRALPSARASSVNATESAGLGQGGPQCWRHTRIETAADVDR
jgi:hypothetical protein